MKIDMDKKLVWASKGHGYWSLERYPWGGEFHRFATDVCLPIHTVIDTFNDGTPRRIKAGTNGNIGIQCG